MPGYDEFSAKPPKPSWGERLMDYLKDRVLPDVINTVTDKVIPQGADEIGNVLMNGSAYLPWPGSGQNPPTEFPVPEPVVPGASMEPVREEAPAADQYLSGQGYDPSKAQDFMGIGEGRDIGADPKPALTQKSFNGHDMMQGEAPSSNGYLSGQGYQKEFDHGLDAAASQAKYQKRDDRDLSR